VAPWAQVAIEDRGRGPLASGGGGQVQTFGPFWGSGKGLVIDTFHPQPAGVLFFFYLGRGPSPNLLRPFGPKDMVVVPWTRVAIEDRGRGPLALGGGQAQSFLEVLGVGEGLVIDTSHPQPAGVLYFSCLGQGPA
jgi:hypothetical protein